MNHQQLEANNYLVISYLSLRKAIGFIGLLLPVVLALGNLLLGSAGLETSISRYYYTNMGNVFVGSLCAIGTFRCRTGALTSKTKSPANWEVCSR